MQYYENLMNSKFISVAENNRLPEAFDRRARNRIMRASFGYEAVKTVPHNTHHHFTIFLKQEPHNAGE